MKIRVARQCAKGVDLFVIREFQEPSQIGMFTDSEGPKISIKNPKGEFAHSWELKNTLYDVQPMEENTKELEQVITYIVE